MKLYEYRVLLIPSGSDKSYAEIVSSGEMLAKDQKEVEIKCARMIPEKLIELCSEIVVAVRPF